MMIGKRYRDCMDESRTVTPISDDGTCRVHCDGTYVGKAKVPVRLFDLESWHAERYGFVIDDGRTNDNDSEDR